MSKVENAAALAEQIAYDDTHGYKWGGWGPEYDCGHLVIDVFERSGIPVRSVGGASHTGNMPEAFMRCGATDVTEQVNLATGAGMKRGDVLVNRQNHAALHLGGGKIVQARSDLDGAAGDSSGQEIRVQSYYNYPWDCVLRYQEAASPAQPGVTPVELPGAETVTNGTYTVQNGDTLSAIAARYGTTWQKLARINKLSNPNLLHTGDVLRLFEEAQEPAEEQQDEPEAETEAEGVTPWNEPQESEEETPPSPRSYTVQNGDTLWGIAERFLGNGWRYLEIAELSGIANPALIHTGDVLMLPGK